MTSATRSLAGRRVLLVEDDYFIASTMRSQFEKSGARVLGPVPSVRDALALIAASPEIDAAVLDINLQEEMVFPRRRCAAGTRRAIRIRHGLR